MQQATLTTPIPYKRMRPLLGTFVEIQLLSAQDRPTVEYALNDAFAAIEEIQQQMSFHDAKSALNQLNFAPYEWHAVSNQLFEVLQLGWALQQQTQGRFYLFSGQALQNLNILPRHQDSQTNQKIDARKTVPLIELKTQATTKWARINCAMPICLDGIAKGYAVDQAIARLKANKVPSAYVNAGGDMRIYGDLRKQILQTNGASLRPITQLQNAALATSQQRHKPNHDFPSWIITPEGQACQNAVVSVQAEQAYLADALTKVFLQSSPSEITQLEKQFGVCALLTPSSHSSHKDY
ncbi:FAD:protein FMN transferase [Thiosulfatimonas sediminis]|uniref:FAD:protein FMN transferase n=1 Tax=Thiosulfatimonas sediminis TaxID=2675054 RepID=A0A6F8PUJ0_9GAMM|nr:FAD:protein FMN transferase [Thiosulfatimonas sediminis]BBP45812.1 FAD:protein FMN transferase [Thiosulfatimonas sediminis]